jgi:hypothetical protein
MLARSQDDANKVMASNIKVIPPQVFYTAMPQLISQVMHHDPDSALVVQGILKRVLTKFPEQAMWPLAWLRGSRNRDRSKIGAAIFLDAQKQLGKHHKSQQKLLMASSALFKFLQDLAQ